MRQAFDRVSAAPRGRASVFVRAMVLIAAASIGACAVEADPADGPNGCSVVGNCSRGELVFCKSETACWYEADGRLYDCGPMRCCDDDGEDCACEVDETPTCDCSQAVKDANEYCASH